MPKGFDRAMAVICTIAILNTMGLGLIMPVMPELLAEFQGGSIARVAAIGGYLSLAFAAMQFVFSPILGALPDRYGRRPILLGSLALRGTIFACRWSGGALLLLIVTVKPGPATKGGQASKKAQ